MSILQGIKGAFFEDDSPTAQPAAKPAPVTAAAPAPRPAGVTYHAGPVLNQDMVNAIRAKTLSRQTALTTLIKASDALANVIPDPATRLKAAQVTAGGGRKAEEFAAAVQVHLNDVDAAERDFSSMVQQKVDKECGDLRRDADNATKNAEALTQRVEQMRQQIEDLTRQAAEAQTKAGELTSQAAAKESDLRTSETEFKAAADYVRDELNGQKQTILSTLG